MKEIIIVLILCWFVLSLANGGCGISKEKAQKMLDAVREIDRFVEYVGDHKDELPADIREKYDELESYFKKQEGN